VALAEGDVETAAGLLREAADGYAACGQPVNATRAGRRLAELREGSRKARTVASATQPATHQEGP